MSGKSYWLLLLIPFLFIRCNKDSNEEISNLTLDEVAEKYVKLSLEIGNYDGDYIDAYYGPEEWKKNNIQDSTTESFPYDELKWKASRLIHLLEDMDQSEFDTLDKLRSHFLQKQLIAAKAKIEILSGKDFYFDKESELLYDAVSPHFEKAYYDDLLTELDEVLPGEGSLSERYQEFSNQFIIPGEKLDTVFKTALKEARVRTLKYIQLPPNESFDIEYVTDKSWSGYNWYKGNSHSLIQINTDLPIKIDRAIDLASHEGYPGHHVFNVLIEKNLVNDKKWFDFSVYPLFSPHSLIAEGTANFGIKMAFPGVERLMYEKEVLFPLAGLDTGKAEQYFKIRKLVEKLSYAGNEAARAYLNGEINREEAAEWLMKYNLSSKERAIQRTKFFDKYRSYVINYNLGEDIIEEFVEKHGGIKSEPERRWKIFYEVLTTPRTASILK